MLAASVAFWAMLAASCASGPELPELAAPGTLAIPADHAEPPLDVTGAVDLDDRLAELADSAATLELEARPWDPDQLGALATFARVLEIEDGRSGRRYRHLFVIAEGDWTDEHVQSVVSALWALPAQNDPPVLVHFDTDERVPFSLHYRFSNDWFGRLESELFAELTADAGGAAGPEPYLQRSRNVLGAYGLLLDHEDIDPIDELDRLLRELPRPSESPRAYDMPEATVLAIGLVLGDELRRQLPGVSWAPADESMAQYYGLRVEADDELLLRPIDFAQLAWQSRVDAPVRAYADLVTERIEAARERR